MKGYGVLQCLTPISSRLGQLYPGRATLTVCNIVCSSRNLCQVQTVSCKPEVLCVTNNYSWKSGCRGNNDFFFFFPGDRLWSNSLLIQEFKQSKKFGENFLAVCAVVILKLLKDLHSHMFCFLGIAAKSFRHPTLLWKHYSVGRVLSHNSMWIGPKIHKL